MTDGDAYPEQPPPQPIQPTVGAGSEVTPDADGKSSPPQQTFSVWASRFKTKLCDKYTQTGVCRYNHRCLFAHGEHDLRTPAMNQRDRLTDEAAIKKYQDHAHQRLVEHLSQNPEIRGQIVVAGITASQAVGTPPNLPSGPATPVLPPPAPQLPLQYPQGALNNPQGARSPPTPWNPSPTSFPPYAAQPQLQYDQPWQTNLPHNYRQPQQHPPSPAPSHVQGTPNQTQPVPRLQYHTFEDSLRSTPPSSGRGSGRGNGPNMTTHQPYSHRAIPEWFETPRYGTSSPDTASSVGSNHNAPYEYSGDFRSQHLY